MRNRDFFIILTLILFSFSSLHSQETVEESSALRKNGVSFNFFGTTPLIGVTYERIVSDNVVFEVGVGIPSIGMGMKIFPKPVKGEKAMLHFGLTVAYINSGDNEITGYTGSLVYFPVGFSYYGKNGFNLGLDGGPGILKEGNFSSVIPYLTIKLGKRF